MLRAELKGFLACAFILRRADDVVKKQLVREGAPRKEIFTTVATEKIDLMVLLVKKEPGPVQ